mgnify:CR=1 FL=1
MVRHVSRPPTVGILTTHPPTLCGIAQFSTSLSRGLEANGVAVNVVRIGDGSPGTDPRVIGELVNGSAASVAASAELLNQGDIAVVQHEYGLYGGADGEEVIDVLAALHVPSIVVAHTVLKSPTPHQRSVLETIAATADHVVVMSDAAHHLLCVGYDVDRRKISTIPHGATVAAGAGVKRSGRPTLLTWGLLAMSMIDCDHQLLPDALVLPLLWLGLIGNQFGLLSSLEDALWGAIAGYLSLWSAMRCGGPSPATSVCGRCTGCSSC